MGAVIPAKILGLDGQVIKDVVFNEESGRVRIVCERDRRRRPVDHRTGRRGSVNRLLRRTVLDVPLGGHRCEVGIEYAETFLSPGHVRVEAPMNPSGWFWSGSSARICPPRQRASIWAALCGPMLTVRRPTSCITSMSGPTSALPGSCSARDEKILSSRGKKGCLTRPFLMLVCKSVANSRSRKYHR